MNTPRDILNYIFSNGKEIKFMNAISKHINGYSIGEITDREYVKTEAGFKLKSKSYSINLDITDDGVLTALHNGLYVSSFISRHKDTYQVHFLCHQYPTRMKDKFDEQILEEVLQYMALKTVIALRLDTEEKVEEYIGSAKN